MPYNVRYTDEINKGFIVVEDSTLNTETSLSLPGKNSTAYGQAIAENFLHLLENFANSTAPERPVEGQIWYDNSDGVNQLKIYDGTTWASAGGLKKSPTEPAVSNSLAGDIWANTDTQQLYLFTGSNWILVGPEFSDGLLTGGQAQVVVGTDDLSYNIFVIKIQDRPAVIISSQAFFPKTAIAGFRQGINAGINIAQTPLVGSETLKFYGVSEKAESLIVGNDVIPASNFLRTDQASTTNFDLSVKNNSGVKIGSNGQFILGIESNNATITQNTSGSVIDFKLKDTSALNTVVRIDSTKRVGINNIAPDEALDVIGNVQISPQVDDNTTGILKVESTANSNDIDEGSIITKGGIGVALNAYIGGDVDVRGILTTGNIAPDNSGIRNIGSAINKFDQVYATTFVGNLQGNVSGTITGRAGSADKLSSATTFAISGDVENNSFAFDGQTGGSTKTFDVRITNSFISNKDIIYDVENADELLINKTTGTTGLYRVSKRNLLKTIPLIPAGVIVPYGGEEAPAGWLLCDGSEIRKSDYNELWLAIQHNFKDPLLVSDSGVNFFTLPDLRGRFTLGADDMGGPAAGRVPDANAIGNIGGSDTTTITTENLPEHEHDMEGSSDQYYAITPGSTADADAIGVLIEPGSAPAAFSGIPASGGIKTTGLLGQAMDTMNPYLTINYIIYTGQ